MAAAPSALANKIAAPGGESGWDINYNDLEGLHPIAGGNFGQVLRGTYLGTEVAVKKLLDIDDEFMHKYIEREMAILKSLRHPNIVQFMGLCKHNSGLYIVTEFIQRGDLRHLLKDEATPLPWKLRLKFAVDAAQALTYLHSKNLIHRDLKSHNLLVDEHDKIKLCDFGFSRQVNGRDEPMTLCGTDEWMAPEVILGENYDTRADVFSFGMILFELISRQKPPKRAPGNKYAIDAEFVKKWTPKGCPPELLELCLASTQWDRDARPSSKDVLERLKTAYANCPDDTVTATAPAPTPATQAAAPAPTPAVAKAAPAPAPVPAEPPRKKGRDRKPTKEEKSVKAAKATKDFSAHTGDDDELTFKKGDVMKVTGFDDDGWARGELNGKVGWFPLDHAELIENHHHDNAKAVKRQNSHDKIDGKEKEPKEKSGCALM